MIRIELTAPGGPYPAGKPVPVTVSVVSTSDVLLVGVLDGSEDGSRYPRYRPTVSLGGRVVAAPPAPEDPSSAPCGSPISSGWRPASRTTPARPGRWRPSRPSSRTAPAPTPTS
nr:hypothetical protein GCM10020093_105030 [Planobispora longispora]